MLLTLRFVARFVQKRGVQNVFKFLSEISKMAIIFFDNYFCVISDFYIFAAVNDSESVSMKRMI